MESTPPPPRGFRVAVLVVFVIGILAWVVVDPMTKVPLHVDEGHHAVGARYVLLDPAYALRPELFVGGHEDWAAGAWSLQTFPPTVNLIYAVSFELFGLTPAGFGMPLLVAGLLVAAGLFALGRRLWGPWTGLAAAGLFLLSATGLREGSQLECEPVVAGLATVALAIVAEGSARRRWTWYAAAGAVFGLAFLVKLWMGMVVGLATLPFLIHDLRGPGRLRALGRWGLLALAFVLVGGSHLLAIAISFPEDLPVWLHVYVKAVTERAGQSGVTPAYYPALIYRDGIGLALPTLFYLRERWQRRRDDDRREGMRRGVFLAAVAGVLVFSVFSKKESAYIYPLFPLFALAAGRGLTVAAELVTRPEGRPRGLLLFGAVAALAAALASALGLRLGVRPEWLTAGFVALHGLAAVATAAGALAWWRWTTPRAGGAAVAGMLLVAGGWALPEAGRTVARHLDDPITPTARALAPEMLAEGRPPSRGNREPVYVSSYWHPLSALVWQRGRPWYYDDERSRPWDEQARRLDSRLRFYQIDRTFRSCTGCPPTPEVHAQILDWLRANMVDRTAEMERLAGRRLPVLVFTPPATGQPVSTAGTSSSLER